MPEETWIKIFYELAEGPNCLRMIRFWGMGEPLLNGDLPDMIGKVKGLVRRTELATNGSLLTRYADRLIDSGLSMLRVSIYGGTHNYADKTGSVFGASDILEQVQRFRELRDSKGSKTPRLVAQLMAPKEDAAEFVNAYTGVVDDLSIDLRHNWGGLDARLVSIGTAPPRTDCCPKAFTELVVKANGDVSVCTTDWDGQLIVGNVAEQSLATIWGGSRIAEIRQLHATGERARLAACVNCNFHTREARDAEGNFL